ncbi:MAG: hypothetical protein QOJ81_532 [Chloroflexota bacterium]|jgi:hypothetical protein|nr:hypothetical protein [Chloroflexota bacterium]
MQQANLDFVIAQAQAKRQADAFAEAVRESIEVGIVVPSILRARLKAAKFQVSDDPAIHAKYGYRELNTLSRVIVAEKTGEIVAMGASIDADDALLHAVLGYFRENKVGDGLAPAGLPIANPKP